MNREWKVWEYSPFLWLFERLFRLLQYLPPQVCILRLEADKQLEDKQRTARRSIVVEAYLLVALLADFALAWAFITHRVSHWWVWIWMSLRIIDIIQISVNVSVFDQMRRKHAVTSIRRSLILT